MNIYINYNNTEIYLQSHNPGLDSETAELQLQDPSSLLQDTEKTKF